MKFFIRFTDNIYRDLERGYSSDSFNDDDFKGLCAYLLKLSAPEEYLTRSDIIEEGIERAKELARWNGRYVADHYDGNFVILYGQDMGTGHDGKIVEDPEVIYEGNIND